MADAQLPPPSRMAELEVRQDEILRQLDELNAQIEQVIRQWSPRTKPSETLNVVTSTADATPAEAKAA